LTKILNKKLKRGSKEWILKKKRDSYIIKAQSSGFRARSAFKLIEINNKFKFIKKNSLLLDLGSSPGSWSQVVSSLITKGKILAVDTKEMKKIKNVKFLIGSFLSFETQKKILDFFNNKINILLSDMAANTTGNKNLDSFRTNELCEETLKFSQSILQKDGILVCKCFMGSEFIKLKKKAHQIFKNVVIYKPNASKKESREIYLYCKNVN